jgi:hypothetical protein
LILTLLCREVKAGAKGNQSYPSIVVDQLLFSECECAAAKTKGIYQIFVITIKGKRVDSKNNSTFALKKLRFLGV